MRTERKQDLLCSFPAVPSDISEMMKGKKAKNFIVFLTKGNELFARGYHRYTNGRLAERQRYVFAKDGFVRYGTDQKGKWGIRSEFREPVFCSTSYGGWFDNSYTVLNMKAISQSCMKYSLAEKYAGNLIIEYLRLYCKHPNIEYLLKSGYYPIIEFAHGFWGGRRTLSVSSEINWKSNNLLKMLNLNRTEFFTLKGSESYYEYYICWRERFPELKPDDLLALAKIFKSEHGTLKNFCEETGLKPQRIARYLNENKVSTYDYSDYIDQCRELGYDMHDTAISMPHNFQAMHERLSDLINFRATEKSRISFAEHYNRRKILEYSSGNLFIRQPESYDEIVAEGKILHHCVGGYAERHSTGVLHIMFIRARDKPDIPYYTMEISTDGQIVQVRGVRNAPPTEEVSEFMELYRIHLSEIFSKKEKKSA